MDLINVRISEIKNINLIYLFSTDSIFTSDENSYLGLKVVYNNHRDYISLDFKDPHFPNLVRKTIERYNQEKDNSNIILLGPLTNKLMEDDEILKISEHKGSYNENGLTLFSTSKDKLTSFLPYLKEIIITILKLVKKYDSVVIDKIEGYNHKYTITYKVGNAKISFPIIITLEDDEKLNFKIGAVDNTLLNITGSITNSLNRVQATWESKSLGINGTYKYDVITDIVEKKIYDQEKTLYYDDKSETVIQEDEELIKFYLDLFEIENKDNYFIKTGDYNYILGHERNLLEEEDNFFVQNHGIQLCITKDKVVLRYKVKNSLSKYRNRLNVDLDFDMFEITMTRLIIDKEEFILVERTNSNSYGKKYNYVVYPIEGLDFTNPFDKEYRKIEINDKVESLYDIRRIVRKNKGE